MLKITDGIEITKAVRDDNGFTTQTLKVTDIQVGDILQVYYSDKTNEIISKISIGFGFGTGGGRYQGQQSETAAQS